MSEISDGKKRERKVRLEIMILLAAAIVTVPILIVVGTIVFRGMEDPDITVADNAVQIKGLYGIDISYADVCDISLIEESMDRIGVGRRTNGYGGLGNSLKGHFKSDDLGEVLLFVCRNSSPTVKIERINAEDVFISFSDKEKTIQLYYELIEAVS